MSSSDETPVDRAPYRSQLPPPRQSTTTSPEGSKKVRASPPSPSASPLHSAANYNDHLLLPPATAPSSSAPSSPSPPQKGGRPTPPLPPAPSPPAQSPKERSAPSPHLAGRGGRRSNTADRTDRETSWYLWRGMIATRDLDRSERCNICCACGRNDPAAAPVYRDGAPVPPGPATGEGNGPGGVGLPRPAILTQLVTEHPIDCPTHQSPPRPGCPAAGLLQEGPSSPGRLSGACPSVPGPRTPVPPTCCRSGALAGTN